MNNNKFSSNTINYLKAEMGRETEQGPLACTAKYVPNSTREIDTHIKKSINSKERIKILTINIRSIQRTARELDKFANSISADFTAVQEPKINLNNIPKGI